MTKIIRIFDLETTGFDPATAGVCEFAYCNLVSEAVDLAGDPINWEVESGVEKLVNPGHPIPPETSAIHHIIDDDVKDADPLPAVLAQTLHDFAEVDEEIVAYAAHNAKFERLFLTPELVGNAPWICTYKAALRLWPEAPGHSNQTLRYWRNPFGLDRAVANAAHRAFPDAYVTAFLLRDMLNDGATVKQLIEWTEQPALQFRCQIGKWRGTPWREVDWGFLAWVSERDFDEDVIFTVRHEMERREKEQAGTE
jgi:exodeoxyribonuclease X